jgi:hypothetical protein
MVIRPISMVTMVGIRLEQEGMKPEGDVPSARRPEFWRVAKADWNWAWFFIRFIE